MAYIYNKPEAGDSISTSQSVLKDNFGAIKSLVDINHVTFGLSDQGKHNFIQIPNITVTPGSIPAATLATEYALYTTTSGLFLRLPSQAAGTTTNDKNISTIFTSYTASADGYCILPCGLKMAWGSVSATHNTTVTFTFSTISGFPGFSGTPYCVQLTGEGTTGNSPLYYTSLSSTSVGVYNSSGTSRTAKILVIGS